jgi:ribosomal-protein-alanine N-acetyltransferase
MTLDDIPAVMAIERLAFPVPWPEQAYRHELLENPHGYFIVVRLTQQPDGTIPAERNETALPFNLFQRLTARAGRPARPVIGFAGLWMFVDEGHISTIASHPDWRGRGVGELLLVSLLREAQRRDAAFATLEVRVSNIVAQNLYTKYGFVEVGRRKRYYRDNNEDALIMTVENFRQPEYEVRLGALEQALFGRLATGRTHTGG